VQMKGFVKCLSTGFQLHDYLENIMTFPANDHRLNYEDPTNILLILLLPYGRNREVLHVRCLGNEHFSVLEWDSIIGLLSSALTIELAKMLLGVRMVYPVAFFDCTCTDSVLVNIKLIHGYD